MLGRLTEAFEKLLYEGGDNPAYLVKSPFRADEEFPARDFVYAFPLRGKTEYVVKHGHLPLDSSIKAVMSQRGKILIETDKINFEAWRDALNQAGIPLEIKGKQVYNQNGQRMLATRTENVATYPQINMHSVLKFDPSRLESAQIVYQTIDALYDFNCFVLSATPENAFVSLPTASKMEQKTRMEQETIQAIVQEQRPVLALKMMQYTNFRMIQRARVLQMGAAEFTNFVEREKRENLALEE